MGTGAFAVSALAGAVSQVPGMGFPITSYQANVPQLTAEIDRTKAKMQGIALTVISLVLMALPVYFSHTGDLLAYRRLNIRLRLNNSRTTLQRRTLDRT